jgi:hypothetical protein
MFNALVSKAIRPTRRAHLGRERALLPLAVFMAGLLFVLTCFAHFAHTCGPHTTRISAVSSQRTPSDAGPAWREAPIHQGPCLACMLLKAVRSTQTSAPHRFLACLEAGEAVSPGPSCIPRPKGVRPPFSPRAPPRVPSIFKGPFVG